MTGPLRVSGRGVAAASAARVLAARGLSVSVDRSGAKAPVAAPVVMLGEAACALLADVFGSQDVLAGAHPIERRVVRWGSDAPQVFAHAGRVIGGERLHAALPWPNLREAEGEPGLLLTTTLPAGAAIRRFGAREAQAVPVVLSAAADRGAALVEALGEGWLFLIPTGQDAGWLLMVGAEPAAALRESRLVGPSVATLGTVAARFETAPRLADDPCAPGMLALGSAALSLDPICGDGTATAVRGGILAAAVGAALAGHDRGMERAAVLAHYRAMTLATMRRHLAVSWPFYARGGDSAWWQRQAEALAEGHAWCTRQLELAGEARFMLHGDRLVAREPVDRLVAPGEAA